MKVVSMLTHKGYLKSQRGPGGGIRLARPPEQINLANVILDTEGDLAMVECFDEEEKCVINPVCSLQHIIGQALNAFINTLEAHTLHDLLEPKRELSKLLNITEKVS